MIRVTLRCYAELNDFLPPDRQHQVFVRPLKEHDSVKDVIEAQGVPHTEVDLILVHGRPVDFSYQVQNGDRISVYPVFRTIDLGSLSRLRPPLLEHRFVLDTHLGKLAAWLRLLGCDALYRNDYDDAELTYLSSSEQYVLLTRDRGLLKRSRVVYGYYVRETDPERQLVEVLRRFDLFNAITPFRRCIRCNGLLEPVAKRAVEDQLEPKTRRYYQEFGRCQSCGRVYWQGSHYGRMQRLVDRVLQHAPASSLLVSGTE